MGFIEAQNYSSYNPCSGYNILFNKVYEEANPINYISKYSDRYMCIYWTLTYIYVPDIVSAVYNATLASS